MRVSFEALDKNPHHLSDSVTNSIIYLALSFGKVSFSSVVRSRHVAKTGRFFELLAGIHGLVECAEVTCIVCLMADSTNGRKGGQLQSPGFEILMSPYVPEFGILGSLGGVSCYYPRPGRLCRSILFRVFTAWCYERLERGSPQSIGFEIFISTNVRKLRKM